MTYLLDTNVVSEMARPSPEPAVLRWLDEVDEDRVFLSVVTIAEIRHGVERMPDGGRRRRVTEWLTADLPARFEGRLVDVDAAVADWWGVLMARGAGVGRSMHAMDAFFAATAQAHDLTLVTRNVKDFAGRGVRVLNPWPDEAVRG